MEPAGWTDLTSPNCRCTAKRQSYGEATVRIYDGPTHISTVIIGGNSGPRDLFKNASFKANWRYFPLGERPYRMDLNDKCYLHVTDAKGVVVWESMFNSGHQAKYVIDTFTGMSSDPTDWPVDGTIYTQTPSASPSSKSTTASLTTTPTQPSAYPSSPPSVMIPVEPPASTRPTCRQRGGRRRLTQTPTPITSLPTYWPTFSPTDHFVESQPSPTAAPIAIMRRRRRRKQNLFPSEWVWYPTKQRFLFAQWGCSVETRAVTRAGAEIV